MRCCNAILEAMACGLPIISSNLSFNDDILNEDYSIRVNPDSIEEIANAIQILYENPVKRLEMGKRALEASEKFRIENRARVIISYIQKYL